MTATSSGTFQVVQVPSFGAEDVVIAPTGRYEGALYTGTEDGAIYRVRHDLRRVDLLTNTGGRPLGIEVDPDGALVVCDASRGLLRVDPATGAMETLTTDVDGRPMNICNNAALAGNGDIWFSDSSQTYHLPQWRNDFIENTRTGRLLRRSADGTVEVVLEGLAFANGVALAADESFVAVAETGARTVVRRWLTGPRAGTRDFLAEDLPGYPDNIARGSDGLIWVTIASPRTGMIDRLQGLPTPVQRTLLKVPQRIQPQPQRTVRVQAYDDRGTLVHDLQPRTDAFHMVTGVREHDGRVWLASLHEPAVAVLDVPDAAARA